MTKHFPLSLLFTLLVFAINTFAQSPVGNLSFSAGVGLAPTYNEPTEVNTPAVSLQFGYRISELFSANVYGGYTSVTSQPRVLSDGLESKIENSTLMLGFKGQVHKAITDEFEIYGGLLIGVSTSSTTEFNNKTGEEVKRLADEPTPFDPNAPSSEFLYAGSIGMNYHIGKVVGIYSEVGYGISLLTVGLNLQF